ncbi:MAG: RES domain-containing protein [Verrucomicrobia bacterium]|nr:RES domain-containing protein [Verrucomicrobiota bacterium]
MRLWRIEKSVFAKEVRSGNGARIYGGRWNSPGRPAIYCAGSLSLAMLEVLAHVSTEEDAGEKRVFFTIDVDDSLGEEIATADLPRGWRSALNAGPCRRLGDAWLAKGNSVALRVPSALVAGEFNCILNPAHPHYRKAAIWSAGRRLRIDSRLFQHLGKGE